MKVLFLTKYSQKGASSRYRVLQYLSILEERGISARVCPLFTDEYLDWIYSGKRVSTLYLGKRLVKRLGCILRARRYDLVVVQKEVFPRIPAVLERVLCSVNTNVVTDYDDAIFVPYQASLLLRTKVPTAMRLSRAVTVGNEFLADYARRYNSRVYVVPTAVEMTRYKVKADYELAGDRAIIGWIGTPHTAAYLSDVRGALAQLSRRYPLVLRCVGTPEDFVLHGVHVENVHWDSLNEAEEIRRFDVGIMPLTDDPYSRGKCGLKLLQYMACGVPAVASPVGANREIILNGENGFLARDQEEWVKHIGCLLEDRTLAARVGMKGRVTVAERYSVECIAPALLGIYERMAHGE